MLELPPAQTFYLMVVAFLVFAAILSKLVLQPTQAVLAERAKRTSGALAEAARMQEEARALKDELDATLEKARHAGSAAGEKIRREAEHTEQTLLAEARADAARLLDEVRERVDKESAAARVTLHDQATAIAQLAAEKILGRQVARA
ncbi:MAG: ATP synthase F0 subunit B [Thermodesulfobacteriota bacterium]